MSRHDAYQPPAPTIWERFRDWRPIWRARWACVRYRDAAVRAWHDRRAILDGFRARLTGEELFASQTMEFGDSVDFAIQRHRVVIATGLRGWAPTGIEYEWRAPRDASMEVGAGVRTFYYAGLTFPTFAAALARWRDDQQQ